ncbi:MAG: alpha/beta fold hydrolase [Bacteroidia bacterium]
MHITPLLPHSDSGGAKPVLVFLHGLAESRQVWQFMQQELKAEFRCIAFDLPGHGDAYAVSNSFSMTAYAEAVLQSLDALHIHSCVLVGHSMGGQIATIMALRANTRIEKLILLAPAGIETFTADEAARLNAWATQTYRQQFSAMQLQQAFFQHFKKQPEVSSFLVKLHEQNYQADRFAKFQEAMIRSTAGMLAEPVATFIKDLEQPILVMYGEHDLFVPNRFMHPNLTQNDLLIYVQKQAKKAVTKLIPFAGHYLPLEYPEFCSQEMLKFIKE